MVAGTTAGEQPYQAVEGGRKRRRVSGIGREGLPEMTGSRLRRSLLTCTMVAALAMGVAPAATASDSSGQWKYGSGGSPCPRKPSTAGSPDTIKGHQLAA
jgi:hypothetical protein